MPKSVFTAEYTAFLALLRGVRERQGVTQIELAKRLRVTQSSVSKCERGERRLDMVEIWHWCRSLEVPFLDFASEFEAAVAKGHSKRR